MRETDESAVKDDDVKALLHHLVETMDVKNRLVLTLLHLEEKTLKEIQAITGWSSIVIRMRAYRARGKLRKLFDDLS